MYLVAQHEGDFAIQRLANIIHNNCDHGCICARIGGDEFVCFNPNGTESGAINLERKINLALENINKLLQKPYVISASIGSVVTVAKTGDTLYSIVKLADDKMYEVKKAKKKARKSERI